MEKKKFAIVALNPEYETFVVHIALLSVTSLSSTLLDVYLFHRSQIASLIGKEAFTKVSDKYVDFADVFSLDLASKLSKHTKINNHAIKLVDG